MCEPSCPRTNARVGRFTVGGGATGGNDDVSYALTTADTLLGAFSGLADPSLHGDQRQRHDRRGKYQQRRRDLSDA